jgi:hypothetical protein
MTMNQLHIAATAAALVIVALFGITNYLLDGKPFHAPTTDPVWLTEPQRAEAANPADIAEMLGIQPVSHRR